MKPCLLLTSLALMLQSCGGFVGDFVGWDALKPEKAAGLAHATIVPTIYPKNASMNAFPPLP